MQLVFYGLVNRFYGVLCFTEKWIASMQLVFYAKMNRFYADLCFTQKGIPSMQSCVLRKNESLLCSLSFTEKWIASMQSCVLQKNEFPHCGLCIIGKEIISIQSLLWLNHINSVLLSLISANKETILQCMILQLPNKVEFSRVSPWAWLIRPTVPLREWSSA